MTRIREQRVLDILMMVALRPHRLVPILFWRVVGKRLRARGRLTSAIATLPFYVERTMRWEGRADLSLIEGAPRKAGAREICVHLHLGPGDELKLAERVARSLLRQSVAPARILLTNEHGAPELADELCSSFLALGPVSSRMDGLSLALEEAEKIGSSWIIPCNATIELLAHAMAAYSAGILGGSTQNTDNVLYGDTGEPQKGFAPRKHWLKPKWDRRMFLSQDYVTSGCALSISPARLALSQARSPTSLYDLVLHVSANGGVRHIERVVSNALSQNWCDEGALGQERRLETLRHTLGDRAGVRPGPFGTAQVRWKLPSTLPTVSVIVATRDRLELLRTCVEGILHQTDYPGLDLIIADNESVEPETLAYMETVSRDRRVQIVRWPHPFNYSAINNFAASQAQGEYLCLLNNDIEVIEPNWLTEMVREAIQPGVGAVGARLLYPDRSVQHAGVAIGMGNAAGHAHRGLPDGEPGYFAQALIARGASAVTAACLVVRAENFKAVGGLDEHGLAVAYNDVDLCLKLQERGLSNIYTPLAALIHHESKSRGRDFAPEHLERYNRELAVFQERWDTKRVVDPWHHRLLARGEEVYSVG